MAEADVHAIDSSSSDTRINTQATGPETNQDKEQRMAESTVTKHEAASENQPAMDPQQEQKQQQQDVEQETPTDSNQEMETEQKPGRGDDSTAQEGAGDQGIMKEREEGEHLTDSSKDSNHKKEDPTASSNQNDENLPPPIEESESTDLPERSEEDAAQVATTNDMVEPEIMAQIEFVKNNPPSTELELALTAICKRKDYQIERLTSEIHKLKAFISKRKQTYKRKRKDEGAPTRALSAYNIFVQDRFKRLAKENENALKSTDSDAKMKRVPPASLVAKTGNQWKDLSPEERASYEERAREDRKRYEEQMAKYQPPDKQTNRKRNKTGYNMFFSAHVLRLKQTEAGVPSERGSVARLVGNAWKQLSSEEKQYYEREADKHNGMNPIEKVEDDEEEELVKTAPLPPPDVYAATAYQPMTAQQELQTGMAPAAANAHVMHYGQQPPPHHPGAQHQQHPDPRYAHYHPHAMHPAYAAHPAYAYAAAAQQQQQQQQGDGGGQRGGGGGGGQPPSHRAYYAHYGAPPPPQRGHYDQQIM